MLPSKRRNNKKNKLEEVIKPRGFERGLSLDKIVGVTNCKNELMFLLKWHDCLEYDLVKAFEVNEKCPEVVIEYYESRCPINQKCILNGKYDEKYESDVVDNPQPIRDEENIEGDDVEETKIQNSDAEFPPESVQDNAAEKIPDIKAPETVNAEISSSESDAVNATFSINVDDTNSVQVSIGAVYSLPLIENQPGEELMETSQVTEEEGSHDTSNCHMPDLQDVEMQ